ncbi:hypothetical protein ACOSP6_15395 [Tenacibaculum sp. MEBiC06402]|uniref:hypothetical protein n=1 Tax=unclassified Tenacibaculum TaxID=2635139 RepID=UPI003B9A50FD
MEKTSTSNSKQWLQKLKDESWEAELLVSAVAIFGTFKLFSIITWITNKFIDIVDPSLHLAAYMVVFFGLFAISILASMFIIHFCLRAYWIGLVGLNSVFPDYSIEDSAYSKIYTEKIISILPKVKDSIEKVDELCSVIFSAAFTFLLIYANAAIISSLYLLIYNTFFESIPTIFLLIPLYILCFLIILQMIVSIYANLKVNHEKHHVQIFSFKVNNLVSAIMFGPLYKSILQVNMIFGSNFKKKKRLVFLMIVFLLSGAFASFYQLDKTNILYLINPKKYFQKDLIHPTYYQTNNIDNSYLLNPEIESDVIDGKLMKVFIPLFTYENKKREKFCGYNLDNLNSKEAPKIINECYQKYILITLNDKPVLSDFLNTLHERTQQFGLVTYINVSDLNIGKNMIKISKGTSSEWEIPFFIE